MIEPCVRDWQAFADAWCNAWNAHDVERVLAHFADAVIFTSPLAARLLPASRGRIVGKDALRNYWSEGLRLIPDLRFAIDRVFGGVDTVVIQYQNQAGGRGGEILHFSGAKVIAGHGTYEVLDDSPGTG